MFKWSGEWGSNPRPLAWQARALPLSYLRILVSIEESNLTAADDMTPVISIAVSEPALTYLVEITGIEPMTY